MPKPQKRNASFLPIDESRGIQKRRSDDRSIICKFFGGVDVQKRYATKSEALDGHKQMCLFIETCVAKGLIAVNTDKEDQPTE